MRQQVPIVAQAIAVTEQRQDDGFRGEDVLESVDKRREAVVGLQLCWQIDPSETLMMKLRSLGVAAHGVSGGRLLSG